MRHALAAVVMPLAVVLAAALGSLLVVEAVHRVLRRLGRRSLLLGELAAKAHRPAQTVTVLTAAYFAVRDSTSAAPWRAVFLHGVQLLVIAAIAWLVGELFIVVEEAAQARWRTDVPDNLHARRVHTQIVMIRRVTVATIAVLAAGVMLMTFPSARAVGTSLLASAGLAGAIAGLAAQSLLRNVFAGIQLAFSDALRLGDVVVVQGEWGRIQEITLSYVVVHIWDDRRLILPTSYFTSTPFENWTRTEAPLLGSIEVDADWALPVPQMREELRRALELADLWDGRVCVLQVIDAVGPAMRLRALVSATDAPSLFDLRCLIREHLVAWLRDHHPGALPRIRAEVGGSWAGADGEATRAARAARRSDGQPPTEDARVFGDSADGRARSHVFVGPDPPGV